MLNFPENENPAWIDVPYVEVTDRVVGGIDGNANASVKALTERTEYLKNDITTSGTALRNDLANTAVSKGAALIGFKSPLANAVESTLYLIGKSFVSLSMWGILGDGSDETIKLTNALNACTGKLLDGAGLTIKITSNIVATSSNVTLQNCTIDASSILTGGYAITFAGTQGTGVTLTANLDADSNTVYIADTSTFDEDGYAYIESDTVFDAGTGVILGQIVKIRSINTNSSLVLYEDVLYAFTSAANAKISPLTLKENIQFRSVHLIGAGTGTQYAVLFDKCRNPVVDKCSSQYFYYGNLTFSRSVNVSVTDSALRHSNKPGFAYGVTVANGCYGVRVANNYGENLRHLITVGDNEGINLFVTVMGNHAASSRDAGIDAHPACDHMVINGNTVECLGGVFEQVLTTSGDGATATVTFNSTEIIVVGTLVKIKGVTPTGYNGSKIVTASSAGSISFASATTGAMTVPGTVRSYVNDGIVFQGLNCVINNNTIVGNVTSGIRHQVLPDMGDASCVITGNNINTSSTAGAGGTGIQVDMGSIGANASSVNIADNRIDGAPDIGIYVYARLGNVKNVSVAGNVMTRDALTASCYLRAAAGYFLDSFSVTGNVLRASGVQNVYCLGNTSPNVRYGVISGNTILGGQNGIRLNQASEVVETGNYNTGSIRYVFIDSGSTDITLDRRRSTISTAINSTYTVLDQDEHIIANRAGTITMAIPNAPFHTGRELHIKTIQAQAVGAFTYSLSAATTAATGTGSVATVSFAVQPTAPSVGSLVVIAGVTPTNFNGTYVATASTTSSVSYTSTATGPQTVAGTALIAVPIATTAATGTGSVATVSFAAQALATPIGSTVVIAGVTPAAFNGTFMVTASTTSSVSYASTEVGPQTVAGTITLTPQIVPIDSATAGTAILAATDGAWVRLRSDGTNWITMQKG